MSAEIEIGRQWVTKANNDLLNADNNLRAEEIPFDTVCFHCQQAAEKLLKAYLTAKGCRPPFTHDLLLLLEQVLPLDPDAESLREDLASLTPFAVEVRYPDEGPMPSEGDAKEARDSAERVLTWLQEALPTLLGEPPDEAELESGEQDPEEAAEDAAAEDTEERSE